MPFDVIPRAFRGPFQCSFWGPFRGPFESPFSPPWSFNPAHANVPQGLRFPLFSAFYTPPGPLPHPDNNIKDEGITIFGHDPPHPNE